MRYSSYKRKNPLAPNLTRPKKSVDVKEIPSLDMFIAASAAYRINGNVLVKDFIYDLDEEGNVIKTILPNKRLMHDMLSKENYDSLFLDEDRENGAAVQSYWRMKVCAILSGNTNQFLATCVKLASLESIKINDYYNIACIAGMPQAMEKGLVRDLRDEVRQDNELLSEHFGKIGEKVSGTVRVTSCFYSQKWQCYYMNGLVGTNVIMWANADAVEVDKEFKFTGKVKRHRDNNVTQLNYVRLK